MNQSYALREVKSIYVNMSYGELLQTGIVRDNKNVICSLTALPNFSFVIFAMLNLEPETKYKALGMVIEVFRQHGIEYSVRLKNQELVKFTPTSVAATKRLMKRMEDLLFEAYEQDESTQETGSPFLTEKSAKLDPMLQVVRGLGIKESQSLFPRLLNSLRVTANYIREVEANESSDVISANKPTRQREGGSE